MAQDLPITPVKSLTGASGRAIRTAFRKLRPRAVPEGACLVLLLLLASSFMIEQISPFSSVRGEITDRFLPPEIRPAFWEGHLFGTDQQGRDIFVRTILGARYSFAVAAIVVSLSGTLGLILGMVSGFLGGAVDGFIMRVVDGVLAFPTIFIIILIAISFGPSLLLLSLILGLTFWAAPARGIRALVLSLVNRDFIKASRVAGASNVRLIARHIFPHISDYWIIVLSLQTGAAILAEASLSFIGVGIPQPTPAWGNMVANGRSYVSTAWWVSMFPGLFIVLVVLCVNMLGDWLRDRLDPQFR